MDASLQAQLMDALHRFRRASANFPAGFDVRMNEIFVLDHIAHLVAEEGSVCVSDIQARLLHLSKPAVSQLLGALEKKGYVLRETDRADRRRVTVMLTPEGERVRREAWAYAQHRMDLIIERFGEENTRQLVDMIARLSVAAEELKREESLAERKED